MAKSKSRAQKNNAAKKKRTAHKPQHAKQSSATAKNSFDKIAESQFRSMQITPEVVEHIRVIGMSHEEFEIRAKILLTFPPLRETEIQGILAGVAAMECLKNLECISEFHELYEHSIFYSEDSPAYCNQVDAEFKCSNIKTELLSDLIDNLNQNNAVRRAIGCHHHLTLFALLEYAVKHTLEHGTTLNLDGTTSYPIPVTEAGVAVASILKLGECFDMAQINLDLETISSILDAVGITPRTADILSRECEVILKLNELGYDEKESFKQLAKIIKSDEMCAELLSGTLGSTQAYESARDALTTLRKQRKKI